MIDCAEIEDKSQTLNIAIHPLKESKSEVDNHTNEKNNMVKIIENSSTESHTERHLLTHMHADELKKPNITSQLDEAKKDNKQLLNILQQNEVPRPPVDLSSAFSTMSIVNLQCKYEELFLKYESLLKIVAHKDANIRKCHKKTTSISQAVDHALNKLHKCERILKKVYEKYLALKKRKDAKVTELKNAKKTLQVAHNRKLQLLYQEYLKHEELLLQQLHRTQKPEEAILLREIYRANKLQHENVLLKQEIACLKSNCNFPNLIVHKNDSEEKLENKA